MATQLKLQQGGSTIEVSEKAFGREFNEALVHQVVTAYMAGGRAGTKRQLSKAEVRGAVPGAEGGTVIVRPSVKKAAQARRVRLTPNKK